MNGYDLTEIKKALEVEEKYSFIDLRGHNQTFSKFIISELKKIQKIDKNPKWSKLIKAFGFYPFDTLSDRKHTIERLIRAFRQDENSSEKRVKSSAQKTGTPREIDIKNTDVTYIKGVGPKISKIFNKIGIETALDLIHYFPRRHINYKGGSKICDLKEGEEVTIFGCIKSVGAFVTKRNLGVVNLTISDSTGEVKISHFYRISNRFMLERYKAQFPRGAQIMVSGKAKKDSYTKKLTLDKPDYRVLSEEEGVENQGTDKIVPIYPLTENLNPKTLRRAISNALEAAKGKIPDVIPSYIKEKYGFLNREDAVFEIHFPSSEEKLELARRTLVFEELFLIQLNLAIIREQNKKNINSLSIKVKKNGLVQNFIKNLPFELTGSQNRAVKEILHDLNSHEPMQRLLQGDVGSGKTVVACIMLLAAIENGYQGAIMAPTEILAEQHYRNFIHWFTPLGLSVGLFLGKQGIKTRREMNLGLQNGQINVAIGTHALVQDDTEFKNLGAIVIDEQHRFGVKQRAILKSKGENPQMLTMTATPIPRTLALTVHGDLDLTIIDELPKGRKPIITSLIGASSGSVPNCAPNLKGRKAAYDLIRREIQNGHQVYIIYPLVDESEAISAKNATQEAERLREEVFPDLKIGLLHGKLKSEEKESVMAGFKNKEYDILVSTTVVEVGVDVENATVIMIENAERFGLSQLHQLRGRVGRSSLQSYCILSGDSASKQTYERLKIMTQTNNGFIIAEKDLEIRGPGEFLGTRQSGMPDLKLADLANDISILEEARTEAFEFASKYELKNFKELNEMLKYKNPDKLDLLKSG